MSTPSGHGGGTNVPPPRRKINKVIFFSSNHIKLTNNNPNKDFKSVKRPWEVEKFQLDLEIIFGLKNKKELVRGIRTHDLDRITLRSYPIHHKTLF